jgi:hypothetical protein
VPIVSAPAWTATGPGEEREADRRGERDGCPPAGGAGDGARLHHRGGAAPAGGGVGERADNAKAHFDYAHTRFAGRHGHAIDEVRAQQDLATVDTQLQANWPGWRWRARR